MRLSNCVVKLVFVIGVAGIGIVSASYAVPLSQYNVGTDDQRSHYVASTLQKLYDSYNSNSDGKYLAECMAELYNRLTPSGNSNELMVLIANEIELATLKGDKDYEVQEIIAGVIKHASDNGCL